MIEVCGLTKIYGERAAVSDVTFTVERGDILGFLGPNGAGKSTTMKMITGLVAPSRGTVRVAGHDAGRESLEARRQIGYMPENVPLYRDMLVGDYLHFMAEMRDVPRGQRRRCVDGVMEQCGLGRVARRLIANLSKGYQQRVGLAQALVSDPPALILDEPTSGLDPQQIVEIRRLIQSFAGRKTVILSTHILPEVSMTCTKVVIINQGRVMASGPLDQVSSGWAGPPVVRIRTRGDAERIDSVLKKIAGLKEIKLISKPGAGAGEADEAEFALSAEEGGADVRPALAQALAQAGIDLLEMRQDTPTLEDIYLRAVAGMRDAAGSAVS